MLNTPGGMSVCSAMSCPTAAAHHGVSGAGLSTTVLPAASAGPTLARLIWCGKFHGVIAATTPTASRAMVRRLGMPIGDATPRSAPLVGLGGVGREAEILDRALELRAGGEHARRADLGDRELPQLLDVVEQRLAAAGAGSAPAARRCVDQSVSSKARRAAAIARPMSSAVASAAVPSTSSVAGLSVGNVPALPATSLPSMSRSLFPSASNATGNSRSSFWTCVRCQCSNDSRIQSRVARASPSSALDARRKLLVTAIYKPGGLLAATNIR